MLQRASEQELGSSCHVHDSRITPQLSLILQTIPVSSKLHNRGKEIGERRQGSLSLNSFLAVGTMESAETSFAAVSNLTLSLGSIQGKTLDNYLGLDSSADVRWGQMGNSHSFWELCFPHLKLFVSKVKWHVPVIPAT
jgi:hypothetical protein